VSSWMPAVSLPQLGAGAGLAASSPGADELPSLGTGVGQCGSASSAAQSRPPCLGRSSVPLVPVETLHGEQV